jgi:hypothetical protein
MAAPVSTSVAGVALGAGLIACGLQTPAAHSRNWEDRAASFTIELSAQTNTANPRAGVGAYL